jgi:hypothetical protein
MAMLTSILQTTRVLVGVTKDVTHFDDQLLPHINTALMNLSQLGVGPATGYRITGDTETWEDYLGTEFTNLESVKNYIALYTRLVFDPPTSSYVVEVLQRSLAELEWRLKLQTEPPLVAPVESEV